MLKSQAEGAGTSVVTLDATFVRDWSTFPYGKICSKKCVVRKEDQFGICKYRRMLIGRDVLNNNIQIILNGSTKKSSIKRG